MNCPVCDHPLTAIDTGPVVVDACVGGCGGIWFDNFELGKLNRAGQPASDILIPVNRTASLKPHGDASARRDCPRCARVVMMRHFVSPQRRVEVDECPACGGCWLDAGELAGLRAEHADEERRRLAVERCFEELVHHSLSHIRRDDVESARRTQRIKEILGFSSPIRFESNPG